MKVDAKRNLLNICKFFEGKWVYVRFVSFTMENSISITGVQNKERMYLKNYFI